ncbi:MAG: nucleoside deaminase [Clostridia bacterium]|nr:nucleoside deaminase [Clostridia bacterium]
MEEKIKYMKSAIKCAKRALKYGEVPIGAVVVYEGKIIGRGYNRRLKTQLASAHAEMMAIDAACKKLKSWRLPGAEIYVTLEPCPMCMGAILNARIDKLYFGAYEQKGRSFTDELASANLLNHTVEVEGGLLKEECSGLITTFFSDMRAREKAKKEENNEECI